MMPHLDDLMKTRALPFNTPLHFGNLIIKKDFVRENNFTAESAEIFNANDARVRMIRIVPEKNQFETIPFCARKKTKKPDGLVRRKPGRLCAAYGTTNTLYIAQIF